METDGINNTKQDFSTANGSRPGLVFFTAFMILLAGFLIPLPEKVLDVLWIGTFCLSGAVTLICIAAQSSTDLAGFVPMICGLTLLRLIAAAGSARHIIRDEPGGILLGMTGSALSSWSPLAAILISLLMTVVILVAVFIACQKATLASSSYFKQILPLKQMGIETDLRLEIIDEKHSQMMAERIASESRFFAGMNATALLMRTETAVYILLLLGCLMFPVINNSGILPSGSALLKTAAPSVVALSVFSLIPASVVAVACGLLTGKDTLTLRKHDSDEPAGAYTKAITAVDLDSENEPETQDVARIETPKEQIAEFEPDTKARPADSLVTVPDLSCRNAKEYYEILSRTICMIDSRPRVILLAADRINCLPVTVAVNIAIRLAQKKQRVLLVDADAERNAVANVFDLDPKTIQKSIRTSSLENLAVCSIPAAKLGKLLQKKDLLDNFGVTLVYAPNALAIRTDNPQIKPAAYYFVDDINADAAQSTEQKMAFCRWLAWVPSIQSILDSKP